MLFVMISFPWLTQGSAAEYEKTGELYYQIFRNNKQTGYAHAVFYEITKDNIKWTRIEQEKKEEISKWFTSKTSRDKSIIILKDNRFYSLESKGEKDGNPYEVKIQAEKDGLALTVMAEKKIKEGFIRHSEYDYTSIDSPYLYLKLYATPYNLKIFDLDEREVLRSKITLLRKEKMEDRLMPFDTWVIRVENEKGQKTDWITPDGILIQSVREDPSGSFLIRASSKEKALAGS
jgi:hypothetical protein